MTNSAAGAYVGVACVAGGILVRGVLFSAATRSEQYLKLTCIPTLLAAPLPKKYSTPTLIQPVTQANVGGFKIVIVHVINLDLKLQSNGTLVTNF